jgi:hypothetical protein
MRTGVLKKLEAGNILHHWVQYGDTDAADGVSKYKLLYNMHDGAECIYIPSAVFEERSLRELFSEHRHTVQGHLG